MHRASALRPSRNHDASRSFPLSDQFTAATAFVAGASHTTASQDIRSGATSRDPPEPRRCSRPRVRAADHPCHTRQCPVTRSRGPARVALSRCPAPRPPSRHRTPAAQPHDTPLLHQETTTRTTADARPPSNPPPGPPNSPYKRRNSCCQSRQPRTHPRQPQPEDSTRAPLPMVPDLLRIHAPSQPAQSRQKHPSLLDAPTVRRCSTLQTTHATTGQSLTGTLNYLYNDPPKKSPSALVPPESQPCKLKPPLDTFRQRTLT